MIYVLEYEMDNWIEAQYNMIFYREKSVITKNYYFNYVVADIPLFSEYYRYTRSITNSYYFSSQQQASSKANQNMG